MLRFKKVISLVLVGMFSLSLMFTTGCSRHPKEEQINKMEETRSACLAAEQKLNEKQKEREAVESQLAQKKSELDGLQKEKEAIQQRLTNLKTEE